MSKWPLNVNLLSSWLKLEKIVSGYFGVKIHKNSSTNGLLERNGLTEEQL